jgi:hypothetical protein
MRGLIFQENDALMWVLVEGWMLADGQPPMPVPGSRLHSVGVRVSGAVTAAQSGTPDGVVEVHGSGRTGLPVYAMTGVAVGSSRNKWISTGRRGEPDLHAGAQFVLLVGADLFQAGFNGWASDLVSRSRVTVTGSLELVGEYEWDAFALSDTRADWTVGRVISLSNDDILVDLVRSPGA